MIKINKLGKNLVMIFTLLFVTAPVVAMDQGKSMESAGDYAENQKPNLVLDLDDVFLHHSSHGIFDKELHEFFSKRSFLINDFAGGIYVVPAYVSEFLKFATSNFNISFFSSSDAQRNKSVVEDMWLKVFGISKPKSILILSRHDCICIEGREGLNPEFDGICWDGNKKKDISKIGSLSNTILADDDPSWVLNGQKKNYLSVPDNHFRWLVTTFKDGDLAGSHDQIIEKRLANAFWANDVLAFYKLVYVAGILDMAAQHPISIVDGLYALQFKDGKPRFCQMEKDLIYYKRGFKVLSQFSDTTRVHYFPEIEKHFCKNNEESTR